ncbi:MAG: hypothetical protein M5R36_04465 [Deltaproteobacteria bacterium]|nr:hypothetical protein [Deltaproteobacteria bacterium]
MDESARPAKYPAWHVFFAFAFFCLYLPGGSLVGNAREIGAYSLAESILTRGAFDIPFIEGTGDLAARAGKYYVDRGPGDGLMLIPFYVVSRLLPVSGFSEDETVLAAVRMAAAFYSVLGLWIFLQLARFIGASVSARAVGAFALGAATIRWRYSTIFYSHITSSLMLLLAAWIIWTIACGDRHPRDKALRIFLGAVLGMAVLIEYANAIVTVLFLAFCFSARRATGGLAHG